LPSGLDSVIELVSIWHLSVELRHGSELSKRAGRIASRIAGSLLTLLTTHRR
jgi:hypothetical protein